MKIPVFIILSLLVLLGCEKANVEPILKNVDFELGESFDIQVNDTLNNENENITICFQEILELDCNFYFNCYGDKEMHFIFKDEFEMNHDIYFNNDTTSNNTRKISSYIISLHKIINDSTVQLILNKERSSDYVYGKVVDFTGLDGCGLIIILDDGKRLEPVEIIPDFTLIEGQRIKLKYTILNDIASICMAGKTARIDEIEVIFCDKTLSMSKLSIDTMPNDDFHLDTAVINNSCIDIKVKYSGGCKEHLFYLVFSNVNPYINSIGKSANCISEEPILMLYHNSNDDECEAYISKAISFDIGFLKDMYLSDSTIKLIAMPHGKTTKLKYP